jgi:signal transduction histidine kinase
MLARLQRARPLVLIADDDEIERFLQRQVLEPAGFDIIEAPSGGEALECFSAFKPDLVVLDVMMPDMNGFDVCAAIRARPGGDDTPILMATALDDVESIDRAYRVGATDFIGKPINWPALPHRARYMLRAHATLENLMLSQQSLAEAQRIAGIGNFRWLPHTGLIECSAELWHSLGFGGLATSLPVRSLLRRIPVEDRRALVRAVRSGLAGKKVDLDHRMRTPAGEVRTLSLRAESAVAQDGTRYLQGSLQDITERKHTELALAAARDEARMADAAKTAFLAAMSHELRTPLNAIIGFSDMIVQEAFGPIAEGRYIDYARNVEQAGQQMLGFVIDVLTIAELEAGRFELRRESIDLSELVEAALDEFRQSETGKHHDITLALNGTPRPVRADRWAVEQMLVKLLSNAAKFSAAEAPIRVTITAVDEGVTRLSVADKGVGIGSETAAMALVPFRQVDGRVARKQGGTGLGLSIVNSLIGEHGGRLTIESQPENGTCVSLDFPAVWEEEDAAAPGGAASSRAPVLLAS